ncbi:hypothetical protein GGR57DRAFT_96245 [Xylariaceae sp. FL1272]|nr:hypothetical protein GGR57DRAFT_96245 [Xylariaceae sp. FL1272]
MSRDYPPIGNSWDDSPRVRRAWQYDGWECMISYQAIPAVTTSCVEWCDANDRNGRLRYHIQITGNGQNTLAWCQMLRLRMRYNCLWRPSNNPNVSTVPTSYRK